MTIRILNSYHCFLLPVLEKLRIVNRLKPEKLIKIKMTTFESKKHCFRDLQLRRIDCIWRGCFHKFNNGQSREQRM